MSAEKLCVGLTGGIGSGKSTIARLFASLGAGIVDTDDIAHQLTAPDGYAMAQIKAAFGDEYLTASGALNRDKMRALIFSDPTAKGRLENILHPLIFKYSVAAMQELTQAPYIILMVPLLIESPEFLAHVDRVLLVNCTVQTQIIRVQQRSALDENQIRAIMAQQASPTERMAHADDVIDNDGELDTLPVRVAELHRQYLNVRT